MPEIRCISTKPGFIAGVKVVTPSLSRTAGHLLGTIGGGWVDNADSGCVHIYTQNQDNMAGHPRGKVFHRGKNWVRGMAWVQSEVQGQVWGQDQCGGHEPWG